MFIEKIPESNMKIDIVVAHYDEDLTWIDQIDKTNVGNIHVYNKKNNPKYITLPNIGQDPHTYLHHIIKNYDNLSDGVIFLQGDPFSNGDNTILPKKVSDIDNFINELLVREFTSNYKKEDQEFGLYDAKITWWNNRNLIDSGYNFKDWYYEIFGGKVGVNFIYWGQQFGVRKEVIHRRPLNFYKNLINYFSKEEGICELAHFMERSWCQIFKIKPSNKIALIQIWIGKIPEYFKYHFETIKNLDYIDFIFFTDQTVQFESKNFHTQFIDKETLQKLFEEKTNHKLKLPVHNYKICDLKASYGHLFEEYLTDYEYYGFYDMDTIMGDLKKFIDPILNNFDVLSFGSKKTHNRISGPLCIFKNKPNLKKSYQCDFFYEMINKNDTIFFEETFFYENIIKPNYSHKILDNVCNFVNKDGFHNGYEAIWSNGKIEINGEEKMIFHFYDKKNTTFRVTENSIITGYKKNLNDDFYWVTYLTEDYEKLTFGLIDSIKKYSNRKCILYTINYDSNLRFELNDQFIFRRLNLEKGKIEKQGRDVTVLCSKPVILSDSINFLPNKKFIYIDTDIYLTNTADNLNKYFDSLENYPLLNCHIHDKIIANDVYETGEWVSPIDILSKATGIPVIIFPRRKANVILYDQRSKWFFEEQMKLYFEYKDYDDAIFRLHDEDSANILLSKYNFTKSLPLIDMEESDVLDMDKFNNYSYNMTSISKHVTLPESKNEIYVFHGFKDPEFYKKIEKKYGNTVLRIQDIIFKYENNTLFFIKNNFLIDKEIYQEVNFNLYDLTGKLLFSLNNQLIFNYWTFYISNISLNLSEYFVEISESNTERIIYKNLLKISN